MSAYHTAQASATTYETSLYTGTVFLFLLLLAIAMVQMRKSSQDKVLLAEKEEKITWLRQIHAEHEQAHLQKEKTLENEILKLTHANENLELRLKEGTKNQVVSKIEELQNKRQTVQNRLDAQ
jgi:Na+-transporting methylmalonyl-CoA/oxaloacetate decarboxylase gamma subunit